VGDSPSVRRYLRLLRHAELPDRLGLEPYANLNSPRTWAGVLSWHSSRENSVDLEIPVATGERHSSMAFQT
jgi:hypothetical protein